MPSDLLTIDHNHKMALPISGQMACRSHNLTNCLVELLLRLAGGRSLHFGDEATSIEPVKCDDIRIPFEVVEALFHAPLFSVTHPYAEGPKFIAYASRVCLHLDLPLPRAFVLPLAAGAAFLRGIESTHTHQPSVGAQ